MLDLIFTGTGGKRQTQLQGKTQTTASSLSELLATDTIAVFPTTLLDLTLVVHERTLAMLLPSYELASVSSAIRPLKGAMSML
jgi:hypothetical protein